MSTCKSDISVETLSQIVENDSVFQCAGYSEVVVSQRSMKDGRPCTVKKVLRVPIRAAGLIEYQEKMAASAPKPPVTTRIIKAGSDEAKNMGYESDVERIVFDETDPTYVDALDQHVKSFVWRVVVFAMDLEWKTKDGKPVTTFDQKIDILKASGITGPHLDKIYADIQSLSRFVEGRTDFLSRN